MKSFNQYITESSKLNLHMTHAEDSMYIDGYNGFRSSLCMLEGVLSKLSGSSSSKTNITTKVDGCVHAETTLLTNRGEMTIEQFHQLHKSGECIRVMGRDTTDKFVDVHNSYCQIGSKKWVEVILENGSSIKLTADHEVHTTNRGWVPAGQLNEHDDISEL